MVLAIVMTLASPSLVHSQARSQPRRERRGFDFSPNGVWRAKARRIQAMRAQLLAQGNYAALNAARGAPARSTQAALVDTLFVPVMLLRFKDTDTTSQATSSEYQQVLFATSPPLSRPYTYRTYYEELSNGLFSVQGQVHDWITADSNELFYTDSSADCGGFCNGISSVHAVMRLQAGFREALLHADSTVDFGLYDNDGPDGIPNSGDDDGYVDLALFVQGALDGACGGAGNSHPWSHRFVMADTNASGGYVYNDYVTNDAAHNGGFIKVRDYLLQSGVGGATACTSSAIMGIGTVAHETGHGLGLPDLYDVSYVTDGIGDWGLMSGGEYTTALSPSRMEAWSLQQFGWVTVAPITTSGTYTFGPAPTSDTTWLLRPSGPNPRGEYFLLENRQSSQSDTALVRLKGPGLLIWHVDSQQVVNHGINGDNAVNVGSIHGLRLEEADGLAQLWTSSVRGDAGDPYPGTSSNTVFDSATGVNPSAVKNVDGTWVGWRVDSIKQVTPGGPMSFRVVFPTALVMSSGATRPNGVMGAAYADTLKATGGSGAYSWTVTAGALPTGVTLSSAGVLSGFPHVTGTFNYTATATSGPQQVSRGFTFNTTAPVLVTANVVQEVLTGSGVLTADQIRYLDYLGNNTGTFDLGDFLAWVNATGAPLAAPPPAAAATSRRPSKRGGRP